MPEVLADPQLTMLSPPTVDEFLHGFQSATYSTHMVQTCVRFPSLLMPLLQHGKSQVRTRGT
jgi:hypothetical protein